MHFEGSTQSDPSAATNFHDHLEAAPPGHYSKGRVWATGYVRAAYCGSVERGTAPMIVIDTEGRIIEALLIPCEYRDINPYVIQEDTYVRFLGQMVIPKENGHFWMRLIAISAIHLQ